MDQDQVVLRYLEVVDLVFKFFNSVVLFLALLVDYLALFTDLDGYLLEVFSEAVLKKVCESSQLLKNDVDLFLELF